MNIFTEKLRDVSYATIPIILSVIFVAIFFVDFNVSQLILFAINSIFLILGLVLFLVGVDLAITPFGKSIGPLIAKFNNVIYLIVAAFIIGFIISFAEPALLVTSNQIALFSNYTVTSLLLMNVVSLGMAALVALGLVRIVYAWSIKPILTLLYIIIFGLALFVSPEILAFAFDLSAATTGVMSVPFLLALSLGLTGKQKEPKKAHELSFGLLALASAGAIISMLILGIVRQPVFHEVVVENSETIDSVLKTLLFWLKPSFMDTFISIMPLFVMFLIVFYVNKKEMQRQLNRYLFGFGYAFLGLFLFLISVNSSYLNIGYTIGEVLILDYQAYVIILFGFLLGVVSILAEPGVYVLTHQIEEVTAGYIKRRLVLYTLAIGVGFGISFSLLRILIPAMQLWHLLLPGYIVSIILMWFIDPIFVGMAFDAGGTATGPITATFTLAFINGAAQNLEGANLLIDGFGMVAMVALMPILTLQVLGGIYKIMERKSG